MTPGEDIRSRDTLVMDCVRLVGRAALWHAADPRRRPGDHRGLLTRAPTRLRGDMPDEAMPPKSPRKRPIARRKRGSRPGSRVRPSTSGSEAWSAYPMRSPASPACRASTAAGPRSPTCRRSPAHRPAAPRLLGYPGRRPVAARRPHRPAEPRLQRRRGSPTCRRSPASPACRASPAATRSPTCRRSSASPACRALNRARPRWPTCRRSPVSLACRASAGSTQVPTCRRSPASPACRASTAAGPRWPTCRRSPASPPAAPRLRRDPGRRPVAARRPHRLQSLDCRWTQVADLSPLAGLTGLQSLDRGWTQVADLSPLAGLTGLRRLECGWTQVADLSPLAGLTGLQSLDCGRCHIATFPEGFFDRPVLDTFMLHEGALGDVPAEVLSQRPWRELPSASASAPARPREPERSRCGTPSCWCSATDGSARPSSAGGCSASPTTRASRPPTASPIRRWELTETPDGVPARAHCGTSAARTSTTAPTCCSCADGRCSSSPGRPLWRTSTPTSTAGWSSEPSAVLLDQPGGGVRRRRLAADRGAGPGRPAGRPRAAAGGGAADGLGLRDPRRASPQRGDWPRTRTISRKPSPRATRPFPSRRSVGCGRR